MTQNVAPINVSLFFRMPASHSVHPMILFITEKDHADIFLLTTNLTHRIPRRLQGKLYRIVYFTFLPFEIKQNLEKQESIQNNGLQRNFIKI